MTATTPVLPTPAWYSSPSRSSSPVTTSAVRCSSKPSSGCACRSRRNAVSSAWSARMCSTGLMNSLMKSVIDSIRCCKPLDAQARIDGIVQQIDNQIDQHKNQADKAQVRGHHRHVRKSDGLDEEQAHARPLEHGLGDNGEGDDRAKLQAGNREHRHQSV